MVLDPTFDNPTPQACGLFRPWLTKGSKMELNHFRGKFHSQYQWRSKCPAGTPVANHHTTREYGGSLIQQGFCPTVGALAPLALITQFWMAPGRIWSGGAGWAGPRNYGIRQHSNHWVGTSNIMGPLSSGFSQASRGGGGGGGFLHNTVLTLTGFTCFAYGR